MSQTYHVATNGADTHPGTAKLPMATIPAAVRKVVPNDTVEIHEGSYPSFELRNLHGRWSKPITIQGAPGELAIIDAHQPDGEEQHVIHCKRDGSWFTLRDLTITTTDPLVAESRAIDITTPVGLAAWLKIADTVRIRHRVGIKFNRSPALAFKNITIEQCNIHELPTHGIVGQIDNSVIRGNHIEHCGYWGEGYGMYMVKCRGLKIIGNTIHDCTGFGLHLRKLHRLDVADNRIYDILSPYWHYSSARVKTEAGTGIALWDFGSRNLVRYNHIWACRYGIRVYVGETAARLQGNDIFSCDTGIHLPENVRLSGNRFFDVKCDVVESIQKNH